MLCLIPFAYMFVGCHDCVSLFIVVLVVSIMVLLLMGRCVVVGVVLVALACLCIRVLLSLHSQFVDVFIMLLA